MQGFIYLFGTLCQRGLNDLKIVVSCIDLIAGLHDLNSARVVLFRGRARFHRYCAGFELALYMWEIAEKKYRSSGRDFKPKDTLCADYANTVGSEVYDVSGASENGVDAKTGLFHAHYSVAVIRGLSGNGPEIELNLHYCATRANESALGDGWAFRFSAWDNRLHKLTLYTGQTITLTADHIDKAKGNKRLAINGVTLTGRSRAGAT